MRHLKIGCYLMFVILAGCVVDKTNLKSELKEEPLTQVLAKEYVLYAMMSSNSYHDPENRGEFPINHLGWELIDTNGNTTSNPSYDNLLGVSFDILKNHSTDQIVVAFRGSNDIRDWLLANFALPISPHYKSAEKRFKEHVYDKYCPGDICNKEIIVTGHSLGGGLALGMSLKFGLDTVVFDSSPRVFDGWGDDNKDANRIGIYQQGDQLQKIRKRYRKYKEVMGNKPVYVACYDFGESNPHSAHKLAEFMLEDSSKLDKNLEILLKEYRETLKNDGN